MINMNYKERDSLILKAEKLLHNSENIWTFLEEDYDRLFGTN